MDPIYNSKLTESDSEGDKDADEIKFSDHSFIRTIYEDCQNNTVWYGNKSKAISDVEGFPLLHKRYWRYPYKELSAIHKFTYRPPLRVLFLILSTIIVWLAIGFVSGVGFFLNAFLRFLNAAFGLTKPSNIVNWGAKSEFENWVRVSGDLTSSEWDQKKCEFFIRVCALSYEDPNQEKFDKIVERWNFRKTRTASRESAQCHVLSFVENKNGFVILVFKGTSPFDWNEWITDATANPVVAVEILGPHHKNDFATVHEGFYHALFSPGSRHWKNILHQMNSACKDIPHDVQHIHIWVTGHSLGAAVATLATCRLLLNPKDIEDGRAKLRGSYTFGTPRVGNDKFIDIVTKEVNNKENFTMHRVINGNDIITTIPLEDERKTYLHFGEARYLTLDGGLMEKINEREVPWKDFLKRWGINLWKTGLESVNIFFTFQFITMFSSLENFYNTLARLFVPFLLFDHYPSQYLKHIKECKSTKENSEVSQYNRKG